jgi:hypothetical protein
MLTRERSTTGELWEFSSHSLESAGRTQAVPLTIFRRAMAVDGGVSSSGLAPADSAVAASTNIAIVREKAASVARRYVSTGTSFL